MRDAEAVTFARSGLDRAAHLRGDAQVMAEMQADPAARTLPLWRGRPLLDGPAAGAAAIGLGWLRNDDPALAAETGAPVFLGLVDGAPRFARDLLAWPGPEALAESLPGFADETRTRHPDLPDRLGFADLRATMGALSERDAGLVAAAKGILGWHATHGFCARCGAPSEPADAGWKRRCPACGTEHFPRTDPVVIMLILDGENVLLGRSPAWPPGMYSLLAGFMEPGESIEGAVRREIREESGIEVGEVEYLSSQPWPFPSSLMIGCRGMALTREIRLDPVELEDARWMRREQVLAGMTGRDPEVRPARKGSIARFLLERWLADSLT